MADRFPFTDQRDEFRFSASEWRHCALVLPRNPVGLRRRCQQAARRLTWMERQYRAAEDLELPEETLRQWRMAIAWQRQLVAELNLARKRLL